MPYFGILLSLLMAGHSAGAAHLSSPCPAVDEPTVGPGGRPDYAATLKLCWERLHLAADGGGGHFVPRGETVASAVGSFS